MKALIDRNIERFAVTHKTASLSRPALWGNKIPVLGVRLVTDPRSPRADEKRRIEDMPALAALCEHAKVGRLEFFVSHELRMERMRQKTTDRGYCGVNLLEGIPVKSVRCPIERPIVISGDGDSVGITEEEQMAFFRSIQHPRFVQLANGVGHARVDDAFHLWTAEEARLDAFLTMDYKFWEAVRRMEPAIASPILVTRPIELIELLSATENGHC